MCVLNICFPRYRQCCLQQCTKHRSLWQTMFTVNSLFNKCVNTCVRVYEQLFFKTWKEERKSGKKPRLDFYKKPWKKGHSGSLVDWRTKLLKVFIFIITKSQSPTAVNTAFNVPSVKLSILSLSYQPAKVHCGSTEGFRHRAEEKLCSLQWRTHRCEYIQY